ncbi:hypothetical protein [Desulfosediminicola sp.]|uniref:hypothetical protein n=1 Tax=Desulfosediminicola sp. TaxID=2886825 RepID=UPI00267E1DE5
MMVISVDVDWSQPKIKCFPDSEKKKKISNRSRILTQQATDAKEFSDCQGEAMANEPLKKVL